MRERAIAEYHDLLRRDKNLNANLFERLVNAMRANHLLYGERQIGVSLRPHFLTHEQYRLLVVASEVLAGAIEKVAASMLATPALMQRIGLTEQEQRLALIHPGFASPAVTTRLDAFIRDNEIKFVEYNAENPSSLTDQSGLNQVLFEVKALQTAAERYYLRQFTPAVTLLQALITTFHEWGGTGTPNIAILDWADLPTEHEFILLRNYFTGAGVPTIICTPDELEYENGRLRRGDFRIDLVYKRIIIQEFFERFDETHPLVRAYAHRDVCLINPFRCKMLHKKALFELLTDKEHEHWFSPAENEIIHRCVPWTRRLVESMTTYGSERIDLIDYVRNQRHRFILKPNDDYGGHGVLLGEQASEAAWEKMLAQAVAGDYVVQEALTLQTEEFPIFNRTEWAFQQMFVDTNPFIFNGKVDGAMVRLSDSPIVNVTSGGGETGFFVIDGDVGEP